MKNNPYFPAKILDFTTVFKFDTLNTRTRISTYLSFSVADPDPGSGAFLTPGSGIRDPGWLESQHLDPGSEMNNPDHIF
jgi:hypothetical protein